MKPELLATDETFRPMMRLALPVLAEESLTILVGFTDWWLVGHFLSGPDYKAAMGLMAYSAWLLPSMFAAIAIGTTAIVSRFVGARDDWSATRTVNQAVLIGAIVAGFVTLAVFTWGQQFIALMQLRGQSRVLAWQYLRIMAVAIPAIMIQQVAVASLRGAGDTVSGFVAKTFVNVVNMLLSTLLVLGPGIIPKLGWQGLAIGTACGHGVGGLILLIMLFRGRAGLQLRLPLMKPDGELIGRLLRVGIPGGIDILAILGCHLSYVAIINRLGVSAAAAHGLGVQIEAIAYLSGNAFQVAAATLAGQFLGARRPDRAMHSVVMTCATGCTVMIAAGCVLYFGGHLLTAFFTGDPADPTGLLTASLLKVVAFSMPSLAITMVLTGALRGAGDTTWPLIFTLIGFLGVRLPGACWLAWSEVPLPFSDLVIAGWNLGVTGAWHAMVADVVLRSLLVAWRFGHGGWKQARV